MTHVDSERIEGVRLALRLARPEDAAYIHGLRMDPKYSRYLSAVTGTVKDQEDWLRRYKAREAAGQEYYYVIERREDGQSCGLVRLYEIGDDSLTWGSWILDQNKPPKAALESAVLSFDVVFNRLGKCVAFVDVRNDNLKARSFYERFGMKRLRQDAQDTYFEYTHQQFERDAQRHMEVLNAPQT